MAFRLESVMKGHNGPVTCLAVAPVEGGDRLVSGSRDKTLLIWDLPRVAEEFGHPVKSLHGHSHFVQDIALSNDGSFALSGSWDGTLRLWDLKKGVSTRRFVGHSKDVLSVAFSHDNRQILSGARDCKTFLWNTIGELKYSFDKPHTEWVSCVRCSPKADDDSIAVTVGWDGKVKVWSLKTFKEVKTIEAHTRAINTVAFSPDARVFATGSADSTIKVFDCTEGYKEEMTLDAGSAVNMVAFCPTNYYLAAATDKGIKIWDLASKKVIAHLRKDAEGFDSELKKPVPLSLAWSTDGTCLFAGYTDNKVRVFKAVE